MFPDGYSVVCVGGTKLVPTANQSGSLNLLMSTPPSYTQPPSIFTFED